MEKPEDIWLRSSGGMLGASILGGVFIGLGADFWTVAATGTHELPFGMAKFLAGVAFCLGFILVMTLNAEVFAANSIMGMALSGRKSNPAYVFYSWVVIYFGNFLGAFCTAYFIFLTGQHTMGPEGEQVGKTAVILANGKCNLDFTAALFRGILGNILVCLSIWISLYSHNLTERILGLIFPIAAFVACGFEYSVANMYFLPSGIWIKDAMVQAGTLKSSLGEAITWNNIIMTNLIPVTLGNIVGGGLLAMIYSLFRRN